MARTIEPCYFEDAEDEKFFVDALTNEGVECRKTSQVGPDGAVWCEFTGPRAAIETALADVYYGGEHSPELADSIADIED